MLDPIALASERMRNRYIGCSIKPEKDIGDRRTIGREPVNALKGSAG